ncbi:MAG: 2-hydroxyacyl-CoA dehydratase [Candidatus Lokiarchaeota archaeon]|nr:2-hydroxyacyl-CoA dehydratase [Candidatus Lokiarchaeota archaeon]
MIIMEEFTKTIPLMNPWIEQWKNEGKKILGYFCSYIPEEIIYAADILPVRVRARDCTDTPMGDAYMTPTACSFTRCCLELANRKEYNFLDGIVSCNCCDQIRRLYDNIRYKAPFPFQYIMGIPGNVNETTLDWFKHELSKFKEIIEKSFNVKITDEKLRTAIKKYNQSRIHLKELYELRKRKNPPITGTDILKVISAGVSIPRDQFNELLTQLIGSIDKGEGNSDYRARLMVVGSMIDEPEYLKVIEDLGGLIVTDSLCFGTRYFWDLVDEDSNPIDALAERYLSRISCPRMSGGQIERSEFMMNMIKDFKVDGVIFERMKFCAIWWAEIFMLRNTLKEEGIPFLDLEREYVLSGAGAMKTRVQTFMEILEQR